MDRPRRRYKKGERVVAYQPGGQWDKIKGVVYADSENATYVSVEFERSPYSHHRSGPYRTNSFNSNFLQLDSFTEAGILAEYSID